MMKLHRVVSAGTPTNLSQNRNPYTFHLSTETMSLPLRDTPGDIVGMAMAKSNDWVYVWYRSGFVSSGTSWNLVQRRDPYTYSLPTGESPNDIVGMAIGVPDDRVYTWYREKTVSIGRSWNLAEYQQAKGHHYTLPGQYTPDDIVGMGIAEKNGSNYVYAWYKDGKVSVGTPTNLAAHEQPHPYPEPIGASYGDIVGMAVAGSNQWVYVWYESEGASSGDLAAVDWCYEIYTPPGMGQTVTITFYPVVENVGSIGWSSPRDGSYSASVSWGEVVSYTNVIRKWPHWYLGPRERKILPGVTVPFHPNNSYFFYGWNLQHDDDRNSSNNDLTPAMNASVKGSEFETGGSMVHKRRRDPSLMSPYE